MDYSWSIFVLCSSAKGAYCVSVEIGLQSRLDHESNVQNYWRETHDLYLQYAGTTFQAGYLVSRGEKPEARNSNLLMAAEAGIRPGSRVLDAGCGVCGPAIDIATHLAGVSIVGITISPQQVLTGKTLVREAGLRIRQMISGTYHGKVRENEIKLGLNTLVEQGLMLHDGGRYLSLPTREGGRVVQISPGQPAAIEAPELLPILDSRQ
jgi:SAM-dependent methyltransferase